MAKVTYTPAIVPQPVPATYALELTAEEMATLYIIGQLIGGSGVRANVDKINKAIAAVCPELNSLAWVVAEEGGLRTLTGGGDSILFNGNSSSHKNFTRFVEALKIKR